MRQQHLEGSLTLVTSCEKHGINAIDYLTDVLIRVQPHPASKIDELLPHRWKPPDTPPLLGEHHLRRREATRSRESPVSRAFLHLTSTAS